MGNDPSQQLTEQIINMRMQAKQLERQAKKFEKEHNSFKKKVKHYMDLGQMDIARVHAESAIHNLKQSNNCIKLSSRMNAIAHNLKSAQNTKNITKLIGLCFVYICVYLCVLQPTPICCRCYVLVFFCFVFYFFFIVCLHNIINVWQRRYTCVPCQTFDRNRFLFVCIVL